MTDSVYYYYHLKELQSLRGQVLPAEKINQTFLPSIQKKYLQNAAAALTGIILLLPNGKALFCCYLFIYL